MASRRYSYGVRFEGVGSDPDKPLGQCFYWGVRLSAAQLAASDYEWVGPGSQVAQGLVALPSGSADSSVSLWTGDVSCGVINPSLHLDDVAGRALMRRVIEPTGYLDADIDAADTTITLSSAFASSSWEGVVVYVGDEAIRLDTHNGDGEFDVTRAHWGTYAQDLPRYTRIFEGLPYRAGREVTLIRFDHADDSEETRWFGSLDDSPPTNTEHTQLEIGATEILSALARGRVNRGAPDLSAEGNGAADLTIGNGRFGGVINLAAAEVRVRHEEALADVAHRASVQVGESLVHATWVPSAGWYTVSWTHNGLPVLGSPAPEPGDENGPVHEVLLVSRELDVVDGELRNAVDDGTSNVMVSSTAQLANPFHPAEVWLAMTIDHPDYNKLGPAWNLGCPASWFDLADIEATIQRTRHLKIDRLVLGWDGEEVNPWDHFKVWCRTYGLFACIRSDGRITVREAREAGPAEVFGAASVTALPYRLHWRPSEGDGVDIISGTYGTLPWYKGAPFEVQILDFADPANPVPQHSKRSGVLAERNAAVIDMPTRSNVGATAEALNGIAAARHIGAPKIGLLVDDQGFGHGDFVRLAPLDTRGDVLRDQTGERIPVDSSAKWVGVVVMKRPEFEEDNAEIDLHLGNFNGRFPRWRAPTAVIESASSETMTLEEGVYIVGGDDGAAFTEGDKCQIWTPGYARRSSEVLTIDAINAHEIVFTTTPSTTPEAGDRIELAFLNDSTGYPEDGNPALFDGLAYTFMCDAANTVGPSDDDGHTFGQGAV